MRLSLLAATVSFGLLAACGQGADDDAMGNTAANSPSAGPVANGVAPTPASALPTQALAGEDAKRLMSERHENFERFGDAMKAITRDLKGDSPNLAELREHAATYTQLGPRLLTWFPPGTGPEAGKTDAKAEIWQRPEDFTAKAQAFNQAATAFATAAAGQDLAAVRAAHANLGKSCKACHDVYRAEHK